MEKEMASKLARKMVEDLHDCAAIASSAIALAAERSADLRIPAPIVLMMLERLCKINIEAHMKRPMPREIAEVANIVGIDVDAIQREGKAQVERIIDDFFKAHKLEQVEVKGQ